MTTEETMLIPTRAGQPGMSVTSERKWNYGLHAISITENSKWVGLSTGTILLGNSTKRKQVFLK